MPRFRNLPELKTSFSLVKSTAPHITFDDKCVNKNKWFLIIP